MSDLDWYLNKLRRKDIKDIPKGAGAFHGKQQDEKLAAEHAYEKNNICPKCRMVLSRNGSCPMEC